MRNSKSHALIGLEPGTKTGAGDVGDDIILGWHLSFLDFLPGDFHEEQERFSDSNKRKGGKPKERLVGNCETERWACLLLRLVMMISRLLSFTLKRYVSSPPLLTRLGCRQQKEY